MIPSIVTSAPTIFSKLSIPLNFFPLAFQIRFLLTIMCIYKLYFLTFMKFCFQCCDIVGWASEEYRVCKNWVMMCWCGYLERSAVFCVWSRLADATASQNPITCCLIWIQTSFYISGSSLPRGSWYHCLPIRTCLWLWEEGCTAVVWEAACCMEVRPGL